MEAIAMTLQVVCDSALALVQPTCTESPSRRVTCTCPPQRRFTKKGSMTCLGRCPFALQAVSSDLKYMFLNLLSQKLPIPHQVWDGLRSRYPTFAT